MTVEITKFKTYPAYAYIETNFGDFFQKLVEDRELKTNKKEECLEKICNISISLEPDEFEKKCNEEYFYHNKLKGETNYNNSDINKMNPFVRSHDKDSFIKWINELTGMKHVRIKNKLREIIFSDDDKRQMLLQSFLNNTILNTIYNDTEKCRKYLGLDSWTSRILPRLKNAHLGAYYSIHWSFSIPDNENIFENIEQIPCRAGLLNYKKTIIFVHELSMKYKVKTPTILDGGFNTQFQPGGKSIPLIKCSSEVGFTEFVHIPNKFQNLTTQLYETFKTYEQL